MGHLDLDELTNRVARLEKATDRMVGVAESLMKHVATLQTDLMVLDGRVRKMVDLLEQLEGGNEQ